jgi:hypothetical protein
MYPCNATRLNVTDAYVNIHNINPQVSEDITDLGVLSGSLALSGKKNRVAERLTG